MPLAGDEDDYDVTDDPIVKAVHENRRRHERKHKLADRDIRKVAHAILQLSTDGTLSEPAREALVEIIRRG